MFKRTYWFIIGTVVGAGASTWVMTKVARARQSLTPTNVRRTALVSVADALEGAGTRLRSPNGQG
jgi:hypothetical protein